MRMYLDQYFNDDSQMYWIYINTWVQKVLCGQTISTIKILKKLY